MNKLLSLLFLFSSLAAIEFDPKGRVDAGAAYFHIRVLEDLDVVHRMDIYGGRIDATVLPFSGTGFCLKPFGYGAGGDGDLWGGGIGIGHYTPLCEKLMILPVVGYSYSSLKTVVDLKAPVGGFVFTGTREHFQGNSIYVGTEVIVKLNSCLSATGIYQYAFAWTHTTLNQPLLGSVVSNGNSQGSNMAIVLDYQALPSLAISAAFGYNLSLDEAKYGIQGFGFKLGVAWCFY